MLFIGFDSFLNFEFWIFIENLTKINIGAQMARWLA